MNISKRALILSTMILIAIQLAACGIATPIPTATATIMPSNTPLITPTNTESPPTPAPTSTSTLITSLPLSPAPDGLRIAYVIEGNLYFQDGSNPPQQLTHRGEDQQTLSFSEDGKKVFFIRGRQEIYSINVYGSEEQALVTNNLLLTFGIGYDKSTTPCEPVLVPHTPLLLFTTCSHPDPGQPTTIHNHDLFILNTDTLKVKRLLSQGQGGNFYVSPNGTMLAIDRQNAIDILGIDGKLIHRKIATYPHSEPFILTSKMYWLPNSSELILALPINKLYDTSVPPTYAIWRYSPDTNRAVQVKLDPPLMSNDENWISPDGHWITYNNFNEGFFLGDLQQGLTKPYPNPSLPHEWSPDSMHFVYETFPSGKLVLYLASVNAHPVLIGEGKFFGWLDASRYMYFINNTFVIGNIDGKSTPTLVGITPSVFSYPYIYEYLDH